MPSSVFTRVSKWLSSSVRSRRNKNKKVVIFDKDGTLIDIHSQWAVWIRTLVARIKGETELDISDKVFSRLGFDNEAGRILPGILGEGTLQMIIDCLSLILQEDGVPRCKADHVVKVCIHSCSTLKTSGITSIGDVARMFQQLRQKGFQIAINTSDSREATLQTLHHLGVAKLVDTVVCGDDDWMIVKPHPVSAFMICAQLGVLPENAIMVGDSPCDVRLGTNAQLGCSIGVLTGIAERKDLEGNAQFVVHDVTMATDLILSITEKEMSPKPVTISTFHEDLN